VSAFCNTSRLCSLELLISSNRLWTHSGHHSEFD
jgi:hypothetical protein